MPDVQVTRAETSWEVKHPRLDGDYAARRANAVNTLLRSGMSDQLLQKQLLHQAQHSSPQGEAREQAIEQTKKLLGEIVESPYFSPDLKRSILDTSSGSALIRQDLDPVLHALFVRKFPAWDRLRKVQANGLVHAFNQITSPDGGAALGASVIADLATVTFYSSGYARKTAPIAEFAIGRGVGLKELGAVRGGGAPYDVSATELANGMVQLARDAQYFLLQGNATNAAGTAVQEAGLYNANGFDGFRGVIGSQGSFAGNSAIQVDQGSLNIFQSVKNAAGQVSQNGGMPTAAIMTVNRKEAMDNELWPQQRYQGGALSQVEIVPGVRTEAIPFVDGELAIVTVPGTTMGAYQNAAGVTVEDIYVIDEAQNEIAWLFSEGWTVLELPIGYSNDLSARYIVFGLYGLVQEAPLFNAKVRCPAA